MIEDNTTQNNDSMVTYSSSVQVIDPGKIFVDGYELSNQNVIESEDFPGSFTQGSNTMEFYIYDASKQIIYSDYNFQNYFVDSEAETYSNYNVKTQEQTITTDSIVLTPESDIANQGFTNGNLYAIYNFINLELNSSLETPYYLAEISSDRTEIRLKSNVITTGQMKASFVNLNTRLNTPSYFDEIYISFGDNDYHIGVNIKYDDSLGQVSPNAFSVAGKGSVQKGNTIGQASILLKLYDPLPVEFELLDSLYVCTKTAETQAYLVNFVNNYGTAQGGGVGIGGSGIDNIIQLKGPNSNLKINEFVNGPSTFKSKKELLSTKSTGSKDQLLNRLAQTGVSLNLEYTTASFADFVNFSSAKARVSNFVEKVSRIQAYEADIATITATTASNPGVPQISSSLATLYTQIENEIVAFDGFDYYQYYATSSDAYPKIGTAFPRPLEATQSVNAQSWILATETSASRFDEDNQNWLYYTIPDFIKENTSNANYLEFVNMIGQSFDEMWLYTKAIAEKNNTTNEFDKGVPLQLADDVITSLGYTGYGNNWNNQDNFFGLIGSDNGDFLPPTGSELITQYIAVNGPGGIVNYWEDFYSFGDYVQQLDSPGFPYPIDKVSKEIFKRLYHNMAYLVKKKGTVSGLRQLINIWGIPSTILRINEFGGKNKDEEDDYDLWYQRFSYAYKPVPASTNYASSSVRIPWQPLYRNFINDPVELKVGETITLSSTALTGATNSTTTGPISLDAFSIDNGSGGTCTLTSNGSGVITTLTILSSGTGYTDGTVITITAAAINDLLGSPFGTSVAGGAGQAVVASADVEGGYVVPDGLGFRFKTTGYPSSSYAGLFNTQSLFVKKSQTADPDVADLGIVLYYTGSVSGSGADGLGPMYSGGGTNAYVNYGEMRFLLAGDLAEGGTAISPPIYLPFFDKGWWSVVLQRDQHPTATDDSQNTTYTLYAANKIYDGADGNQIGFTGSVSLTVNGATSSSLNESWNNYVATNNVAGGYLGGWGDTLGSGETGSIGTVTAPGGRQADSNIGIGLSGKNFSGSFQEFRYYSNDISQSVFNDFVMNPESIEGNNITGSESSFDIVNFRAPLGNELENLFTSSLTTANTDVLTSLHPAITGSSPLTITGSFINPANGSITSSYDVNYNANTAKRTYSETNKETYFLDQPSIGVRNRVSNKIRYSTNLNFGKVLSDQVSIQQDPPMSQSYTDNINLLEVAFSPTDEVNDDIIQSLGYGAIQEVIADPRFRSSSDDNYPGLQAIAKEYFQKYYTSNTFDYLRLIRYFDDSLFRAIKNYVPARTSVSTGIVIKQNMLERSRYREPQVDIVTTQSYAPFNQPLTFKNLELTGSITTHQLWNNVTQNTYYSSSDIVQIYGGPGGSVNQYNVLKEGGAFLITENDNLALTAGAAAISLLESDPSTETSSDINIVNAGPLEGKATAILKFTGTSAALSTGNANYAISNVTDGFTVKSYAAVNDAALQNQINNGFVCFLGNGNAAAKSAALAQAINSPNGHGIEGLGTITTSISTTTVTNDTLTLTNNEPGTTGNDAFKPTIGISIAGSVSLVQAFSGGTSRFNNVFLNTDKSVETPLYVDYYFTSIPASPMNLTIQASSSLRGVVMTNVSTYTVQDPPGAILPNSLFTIHPGEDMYILISTDVAISIGAYQIALGESTTKIPDSDTIPQSQQGYFTFNTTSLGIDTVWDSYQEQFYNGEYSGSEINVESKVQYNPYRKVKPNSTAFNNIIIDNTDAYVSASAPVNAGVATEISLLTGGSVYSVGNFSNISAGGGGGSGLKLDYVSNGISVTSVSITSGAGKGGTGYAAGETVTIPGGSTTLATANIDSVDNAALQFTSVTANGFTFNNATFGPNLRLSNLFSQSIIPGQNYLLTYDITTTAGTAGKTAGFNQFNTFIDNGSTVSRRNGIGFLGQVTPAEAYFQTRAASSGTETTAISHSFKGTNLASNGEVNENQYMGAMFDAQSSVVGTVSNMNLQGVGGLYDLINAPIFFDQQDQGYDNQADYQNMSNEDAQGNIISPIFLIENSESVLFNNSDYNPLSNNVNLNRSSSYRYILSYGATQSVPNNFDLVVTQSYFPSSPSGTFPERADVPDSNYTMPSSVNSRYGGTKLKSLDYNFFTPSGSIGPEISQPIMPVNRSKKPVGFRVANNFLDGSVTSSFIQTELGGGSASWSGDDLVPSGSAVIDKHPIYMARFENSYEQLALYNSYQFNIDQLIEIPRTSIAGQEITPNSITIDGSNENKKFVSAIFEPNRKAQVSYLNPKTRDIDYSSMQIGNYNIEGGAVEFITINANAKSRVSASLAYQYTLGNNPSTGSRFQTQDTIQMVTGSNTIAEPGLSGLLTGTLTTTGVVPTLSIGGVVSIQNIPLTSIGGQGSGARITLLYTSNAFVSATITTNGQGYSAGDVVTISQSTINTYLANTSKAGGTASGPISFLLASGNIVANPNEITSFGFILSGSLTTDLGTGAKIGKVGSVITGTTPATTPNGQYNNILTVTSGSGRNMFVNVTVSAGNISQISIASTGSGGFGYQIGDVVTILESIQNENGFTLTVAGDYDCAALTADDLTGGNTPFMLNFNPSPVSSSNTVDPTGVIPSSVPGEQQLLIGGPQLALYHAYNATVSSSLYSTNPNQVGVTTEGPFTDLWTTSGSNPANAENYYNWNPDGSDCTSYQDPNSSFLIERGDVLRVEGILNTIDTATSVSQSTNVIEDFIVEEIQDYYYTSSFADSAQNAGGLAGIINYPSAQVVGNGGCMATSGGNPSTFTKTIIDNGAAAGNFVSASQGDSTEPFLGGGGTITVISSGTQVCPGWTQATITGGSNYQPGNYITIPESVIGDAANWTGTPPSQGNKNAVTLRVLDINIINGNNNNFTVGVDVGAPAGATVLRSGSVNPYHLYEEGEVALKAPTFIRTTRDPRVALSGLIGGAITKFTIRRQIEADDKVMLKQIPPPSGSVGVNTPSGQGFLIPNDFSPVQKSNALNIINQLKAKNAFDKPEEPGITNSNPSNTGPIDFEGRDVNDPIR